MNELLNVREKWLMYDTVLIANGIAKAAYPNAGYFDTFLQLSAANEISFFNTRNRSMVGEAYCNQDSTDKMTWPFWANDIGVQFFALPMSAKVGADPESPVTDQQSENNGLLLFLSMLKDHCSVTLKVNVDEKLTANAAMLPAGVGLCGHAIPDITSGGQFVGLTSNWSNGEKRLSNRFKFPDPIEIPRGHTFSVKLEFSNIGKQLLRSMTGPGIVNVNSDEIDANHGDGAHYVSLPQICGIRVSLIGTREVQQRGALHV